MQTRYRLFQRGNGIFFMEDNVTRKQESLRTRDNATACRIFHARNEAYQQPSINRQIAKAYLTVGDPLAQRRDWQYVMDAVSQTKKETTRERWDRAMKQQPFEVIRKVKLLETQADHFLQVLRTGTVSTNIFLRRLHNFALEMDWIPKVIIPRRQWLKIKFEEKRPITLEEHLKITAAENNPEWRGFYNMLWHLGGAQSDIATLKAEDVDWNMKAISFSRAKTGSLVIFHFGRKVAHLLGTFPSQGFLFPHIAICYDQRATRGTRHGTRMMNDFIQGSARLDRHQSFQLPILVLQGAQSPGFAHFHPAIFVAPLVNVGSLTLCRGTHRLRRRLAFGFPHDTDNLLLTEFTLSHSSALSRNRTLLCHVHFLGDRSNPIA
jgi:hypothetical protein